jgi:hypothetical protein
VAVVGRSSDGTRSDDSRSDPAQTFEKLGLPIKRTPSPVYQNTDEAEGNGRKGNDRKDHDA